MLFLETDSKVYYNTSLAPNSLMVSSTILNNINKFGKLKIGEQFLYKKAFSGNNSKNYKYGDVFELNLWSSYSLIDNVSSSIRINYNYQKKMNGSDNEMNPRMSPAMDSKNQGFNKVNLGLGFNLVNHTSYLKTIDLLLNF